MTDKERFRGQLELIDPDNLQMPIDVIGAGSVGSFTVLALVRMGCSDIVVWDGDKLEEHNISNQFCRHDKLGEPKASALRDLILELDGVEITAKDKFYAGETLSSAVVISGVDSMKARKNVIWPNVKKNPFIERYIDCRTGDGLMRVFAIQPSNPDHIKFYENPEILYDDTEAVQLPCTRKGIIHTSMVAASIIARLVQYHADPEQYKIGDIEYTIDFNTFTAHVANNVEQVVLESETECDE